MLGLRIDDKLTFSYHIEHLIGKLSSFFSLTYKLKYMLPFHTKIMFFNALVVSSIQYCIILYSTGSVKYINKLSKIYYKIVRSLFFPSQLKFLYDSHNTIYSFDHLLDYLKYEFITNMLKNVKYYNIINSTFSAHLSLRHIYDFYFLLPKKPNRNQSLIYNLMKYYNCLNKRFRNKDINNIKEYRYSLFRR